MTNILNLPQLDGAQTVFEISNQADWTDSLFLPAPGFGFAALFASGASITASSVAVANLPAALVAALSVGGDVCGAGIPAGATVAEITSATSVALDADHPASVTNAAATLTFLPLPLDLAGLSFKCTVKQSATDKSPIIRPSTEDGSLVNGDATGVLSWAVPQADLEAISPGTYLLDLSAFGDGHKVDLFAGNGPGSIIVNGSHA